MFLLVYELCLSKFRPISMLSNQFDLRVSFADVKFCPLLYGFRILAGIPVGYATIWYIIDDCIGSDFCIITNFTPPNILPQLRCKYVCLAWGTLMRKKIPNNDMLRDNNSFIYRMVLDLQ